MPKLTFRFLKKNNRDEKEQFEEEMQLINQEYNDRLSMPWGKRLHY